MMPATINLFLKILRAFGSLWLSQYTVFLFPLSKSRKINAPNLSSDAKNALPLFVSVNSVTKRCKYGSLAIINVVIGIFSFLHCAAKFKQRLVILRSNPNAFL